jgi:hypothetical protein
MLKNKELRALEKGLGTGWDGVKRECGGQRRYCIAVSILYLLGKCDSVRITIPQNLPQFCQGCTW